jgi:hypothetical protein
LPRGPSDLDVHLGQQCAFEVDVLARDLKKTRDHVLGVVGGYRGFFGRGNGLAASCAQAGRLDEAAADLQSFLLVAEREMAVLPGRTVGAWRSCWRPIEYQHAQDFDRLFDGLRKAGLPE